MAEFSAVLNQATAVWLGAVPKLALQMLTVPLWWKRNCSHFSSEAGLSVGLRPALQFKAK